MMMMMMMMTTAAADRNRMVAHGVIRDAFSPHFRGERFFFLEFAYVQQYTIIYGRSVASSRILPCCVYLYHRGETFSILVLSIIFVFWNLLHPRKEKRIIKIRCCIRGG